jgi:acetyl-CoA decarbonylase/synthase complex subunit beta
MANGFHADIGPQYEGEVIRKEDLYIEFGGPKVPQKFELATLKKPEEIENEKVEIIGPDLDKLAPYDPAAEKGGSYPIAILIDVAGSELDKDAEPIIERRIHMFTNMIEGWYHMNQRQDVWIRMSKNCYKKGFNSLRELGEIYNFLFTSELPIIEKIQTTLITDPQKIAQLYPQALKIYEARDARARALKDEDVDTFYGCTLCQSFAPTHISIIAPNRIANCGAINWFDGRAAAKIDPEGPIFAIPKGNLLDPVRGEYEGVNKIVQEKSLGTYDRVYLYSAFEHPHTSCGCFQAIVFYIPEADAFGVVHREFKGGTVIGETFSHMAGETSGGKQIEGRLGTGLEQLRSPKFIQADGGLARIVWMPKEVKERYKDALEAKGLYDKIATEEDVKNVDELLEFLQKVGHPWIKGEVQLPT